MIFWGWTERSTYHATCVKKVYRYLKKKCDKADYERKLVADRITDVSGCNTKSKTWYLCEIKVNWNDAQKGVTQIHDTAFRFRRTHRGYTVLPVLAIPSRLKRELIKFDNWNSLRDQCRNSGIAIWVIEQSTVREEIISPKTKADKTKSAKASTAKKKTTRTKQTASKTRATKTGEARKSPTTKKKTTRVKTSRSKKTVPKSSKTKKVKTQRKKRKISKTRAAKSKTAKIKTRGRK